MREALDGILFCIRDDRLTLSSYRRVRRGAPHCGPSLHVS